MCYYKIKNIIINNRLIKDSFWSLSGNVIYRGLSLVTGIIIARILGKEIFGEYSIIKSTFLSIGALSTFGLGNTATKFIAENRNYGHGSFKIILKYTLGITLFISSFLTLILFLTANHVAEKVLSASHLGNSLKILSILIILNALTATQTGIIAGIGKFKELARINSIIGIIILLTSSTLTYYFGLNGALTALLISQVINYILNKKLIDNSIPMNIILIKSNNVTLRKIIWFSTPIALQDASYSLTQWFSNILLIRVASYGELGLYTAASQWIAVILFIPVILQNVVLTHLAESNKDEAKHSSIIRMTLLINFSVTFFFSLLVFIFSSILSKLYGSSFSGLDSLINIAVLITIFASMSNVYAQAYMSKGMTWLMFYLRFIRDIVIILLFLLLNKIDSITGVKSLIYSNLIMSILFLLIMMLVYKSNNQKPACMKSPNRPNALE